MQGQLGVSKKKPLIEVVTSDDEKTLFVYIGLLYYATIPNEPKSVRYRLLLGQLAAARFSIVQLMRVFNVSRPTIYRYRDYVCNCADEAEMFAQLRGHHCDKTKLTPEVEAFIKTRFERIYLTNRGRYNRQIRAEVEDQFDIKLSPEAVRQVIAPLRREFDRLAKINHDDHDAASEAKACQRTNQEESPTTVANTSVMEVCTTGVIACEAQISEAQESAVVSDSPAAPTSQQDQLYLHAGLLVLNYWIASLAAAFTGWGSHFLQWLYQVYAGAVNFEQSRYLPRNEISCFIGEPAVSVSKSRFLLKKLAHGFFEKCLQRFVQINWDLVRQHLKDRVNYFYIDGHFDPYYGKIAILKGWACLFNRTMTGSNHYVIHDSRGYPFFKELKDCYDDFRVFIKYAIEKLQTILGDMLFGIVFDRGAFSKEILQAFVEAGVYFLTWQKYFDIDNEPPLDFCSKVVVRREVNEVGKFQPIPFECAETVYHFGTREKDQCRKLVIRTQQHKKNKRGDGDFYAAILSNDPQASHQKIVETMTGRWSCQENDFRYEKKHFGLDQITSYDTTPVESLQEKIDEHKGQLQAWQKELAVAQAERQKIYEALGVKKLTKRKVSQIEKDAAQNPKPYELVLKLQQLRPAIKELSIQSKQLEKKIERQEKIDAKGYVKLDYRKKQIFDHLRFTARNVFYTAIEEFKEHYTNLRDLHVVFWKLVRSSGFIQYDKHQITVTLNCPFFEGAVLKAVQEFLASLNDKGPVLLDGTGRKIHFRVNSELAN